MALTFGTLETRMETKDVLQRGNTLKATFSVTNYNSPYADKTSHEYRLSGSAFQVRVVAVQTCNGHINMYNNLVFIRFRKLHENDELNYRIKLSSNDFNIENKVFVSDDGTWRLIHENKKQQYSFNITVVLDVVASGNSFATLHDDTELTDFELRGEDGSVHMHKAVLAACSPVLRRMLGGTWRETTEGRVDVTETSQMTLQHLKDFIYLHQLPDNGLEQLLLLASYYMMPDLEQKCVEKLVDGLTPQNACELLEFAAKHKVTRLILAILECVQNGVVKVNDIRNYLSGGGD